MHKKILPLTTVLMSFLLLSGCLVAESKYLKKVEEADNRAKEIASLQDKNKQLTEDRDQLKEAFANATKEKAELEGEKASLKGRVSKLEQDIANLKKSKEEEIQAVKKAQDELLEEMKSEVAKGQVTITELKGKLTVDVVEKILFDSGEAEVKPEGLSVLKRVCDVLKNVKDRTIRIEGHTDNIPIKGQLAKRYPTNWELSAARAINVTRFLQKQDIDPTILSATAFGEYKPIADNSTSEGRAKNRRIAIILLPKE